MKRVTINSFGDGITNDPRDPRSNVARSIQHFDAFSRPRKLTPHRSYENGDTSSSTNQIANFLTIGSTLYGLGIVSGGSAASVLSKTDFTTQTWSAFQNVNGSARTTADTPFFTYYPKTGKIYGVRGGQYIWAVTVSGPSADASYYDLGASAYSTVSNGLVHSKDDILYFGYNNKIASINNASVTAAALTLPVGYVITSICEYGNYLAIGCRSSNNTRSRVFLWDRDSSLTTLSETIDWGEGDLMCLEELGGNLLGLSAQNSANYFKASIVLRQYTGAGGAEKIAELNSTNSLGSVALYKQKVKGRFYVPVTVQLDGTNTIYASAAIGRASPSDPFSITFERLTCNDSSAGNGVNVQTGIYLIGDYFFSSYIDNASAYVMAKTDDAANYTITSVYETIINQGMDEGDKLLKKQLVSLSAMYESLPTAGQVVAKYKVDGGAFATVFTETTDGAMASEFVKAGANEFTAGREYEERIESTGGAEITGLVYKYEVLKTNA